MLAKEKASKTLRRAAKSIRGRCRYVESLSNDKAVKVCRMSVRKEKVSKQLWKVAKSSTGMCEYVESLGNDKSGQNEG